MMKIPVLLTVSIALFTVTPLMAVNFSVNQTQDMVDAIPGDGLCDSDTLTSGSQCSLRAAIQEANALTGSDNIALPPGVFTLSITGAGEDISATGDLDITDDLVITGTNMNTTIIDGNLYGNGADRLFDISAGTTVQIDRITIRNGFVVGEDGGGILNKGKLTLSQVLLDHNEAAYHFSQDNSGNGGGIYNTGSLTLNKVEIRNNKYKSIGSGGGIYNSGALTLNNSSVSRNGNANLCNGSGIFNSGTFTSNNSTISNNLATDIYCAGPAILNSGSSATTVMNNNTISDNIPIGIWRSGGTFTLQNTLLASNGAKDNSDCPEGSLSIDSSGHNIIAAADCVVNGTTGDQIGSSTNPIDAHLGKLLSFPAYQPLLNNSPAIDAGNPAGCSGSNGLLNTDQRAVTRDGNCDIGAYEFTTSGPASRVFINNGSNQHIAPNNTFRTDLEVAILDDAGNPVSGIQVTFSTPATGPGATFAQNKTLSSVSVTDETGIGIAEKLTANNLLGDYVVNATIRGISSSAIFNLNNLVWYVSNNGSDTANDCLQPSTACLTINGVIGEISNAPLLVKHDFVAGDMIRVDSGTYTGSGIDQVALIDQSVILSGGWNSSFTTQTGMTTIDGENAHGGITVWQDVSDVSIERFSMHNGIGRGGGIRVYSGSSVTIYTSNFENNLGEGGGISNEGTMLLIDSTVSNNNAPASGGGGIINFNTLTIKNSIISGNSASHPLLGGGGIYNDGSLDIFDTTISGNTSSVNDGGGIFNSEFGELFIEQSTLSENQATNGGAIFNLGQTAIGNTTISGNHATQSGGGVFNSDQNSAFIFLSSTISNNSAASVGGGIYAAAGNVGGESTIVAANQASTSGADCSGLIVSTGYNLLSNISACNFITKPTDITGVTANLGPLHDNGGSSQTHALLSGSPAIDAANIANCPPTDQRGESRPVDGNNDGTASCDIGAYEAAAGTSPTPSTSASSSDSDGGGGMISYWLLLILAVTGGQTVIRNRRG